MYQHFKHDNDPWLSSVLRPLPTLVFVAGIFVAREALYPSSGMGVDVQIFTMASFVFFGLLLGLRERVKSRKLQ